MSMAEFQPRHFRWAMRGLVAIVTLDRPEKKNPLTFESYAELRDCFRALVGADDVRAVVLTGAGGNFCSGGDVMEIIGPLLDKDMRGLLAFTRMTGDLVKAIRACPQPVIAPLSGRQRKATTPAISRGCSSLPCGLALASSAAAASRLRPVFSTMRSMAPCTRSVSA